MNIYERYYITAGSFLANEKYYRTLEGVWEIQLFLNNMEYEVLHSLPKVLNIRKERASFYPKDAASDVYLYENITIKYNEDTEQIRVENSMTAQYTAQDNSEEYKEISISDYAIEDMADYQINEIYPFIRAFMKQILTNLKDNYESSVQKGLN